MSRILRYEIPVDRAAHVRILPGPVLHVAARRPDVVELWCQDRGEQRRVELYVVGTAHPWPAPATYVGTALAPDELVWHLLALGPDVSCRDCGHPIAPGEGWSVYDHKTGLSTRGYCSACAKRRMAAPE